MKKSSTFHSLLFTGLATVCLSLSPVWMAQAQTPDMTQSTKTSDSTADKNSSTTGTNTTQASAPDKTNSKDTMDSLDKDPSTTSTDSADKSATKEPTGTTADQPMTTASSEKSQPVSDNQFILDAAQGGMTEIDLGKLAQEKGSSPDVKQFGARMVKDHSKLDDELKTVAEKKGVTVPGSLDAKHQAMIDRFDHLSGTAFDHAYVRAMVQDHEKTAAEFRQVSTDAQDPDVKAFAGNTLKIIESHLSAIKTIQSKMQ